MKCPICESRMERGYLSAVSIRRSDPTRLEWHGAPPRIGSVPGIPLSGYANPGAAEGQRCVKCGAVIVR